MSKHSRSIDSKQQSLGPTELGLVPREAGFGSVQIQIREHDELVVEISLADHLCRPRVQEVCL